MSVRIRYACPHCNRRIAHHPELGGQLVICSACKGEFYEPTDPLPGKPAEKALQPLPTAPRRLRVPIDMNPKYDLAVLSRHGSSDHRSIEELVEAVMLNGDPSPTEGSDSTEGDFVKFEPLDTPRPSAATTPAARPASTPPRSPAPLAPTAASKLAGPPVRSLLTPTTPKPANPPPAPPQGAFKTSPTGASPSPSGAPMALPVGAGHSTTPRPVPAPGLSGVSPQQMVEELRRRGLGAVLVTCEMAPARNLSLAHSDNMTADDAATLLRQYLGSQGGPQEKPASRGGLLQRIWKSDESSAT
jgi:hypothetical protein